MDNQVLVPMSDEMVNVIFELAEYNFLSFERMVEVIIEEGLKKIEEDMTI